jgi:hypothetical protein
MTLAQGFIQLGAGLSVGLAGLAAGFAVGIVGDAGVRGTAQQPRLFVGMVSCCNSHALWSRFPNQGGLVDFNSHFRRSFGTLWYVYCLRWPDTHTHQPTPAGLIVALIMNTQSQGLTVRLFLSFTAV